MATSHEISKQVEALQAQLAEYEAVAADLSLAAVEGDTQAIKRLSETQAVIDQALADRKVLEQAAATARFKEAKANEEADAERRAIALNEARNHAGLLIEKAKKVDALITEIKAALPELSLIENAIWTALRSAKMQPPGEFIGRKGLSVHATATLQAYASGNRFQNDSRPVADLANVGWKFLLNPESEVE